MPIQHFCTESTLHRDGSIELDETCRLIGNQLTLRLQPFELVNAETIKATEIYTGHEFTEGTKNVANNQSFNL